MLLGGDMPSPLAPEALCLHWAGASRVATPKSLGPVALSLDVPWPGLGLGWG